MNFEHGPSLLAILDDDKSVQSALQDLIESEGMSTLCFDSAEQFLDSRAKEVLPLLVSGLMNKQAAARLGITEYTVQVHRGHIMRKMSAGSFAALVRMAETLSP